jgi:hypothetical protein
MIMIAKGNRAQCVTDSCKQFGGFYLGSIGGVAADGKTPKDTRTPAQRRALRVLVESLQKQFPQATIHGHYEFAAKACPSFKIEDL